MDALINCMCPGDLMGVLELFVRYTLDICWDSWRYSMGFPEVIDVFPGDI